MSSDEYNLKEAGMFDVVDLLEFQDYELEQGHKVRKVWITAKQANHLVNSFADVKIRRTGKKLVDYWHTPTLPIEIETLHGIEIGVEV